jgi:putative transposase
LSREGHGKDEAVTNASGNTRTGHSAKTLQGEFGELPLDIPGDRQGAFEPRLVGRHQTRWSGFDDKIISLYARGLSVREIQGHLEEMYGTEVSPTLISAVTDAVSEDVKLWQARPLNALYPIIYLDCIHVKEVSVRRPSPGLFSRICRASVFGHGTKPLAR